MSSLIMGVEVKLILDMGDTNYDGSPNVRWTCLTSKLRWWGGCTRVVGSHSIGVGSTLMVVVDT